MSGNLNPSSSPAKRVYITFVYHGNMCWDRYTKRQIWEGFPAIYRLIVDVWKENPELRSNVELSGVTVKTLQKVAPDLLEDMKRLEEMGRLVFVGTHYAAQVNLCTDEETELRSIWLGTEISRRELDTEIEGFFPQEISYYPQLPRVLSEVGLKWTIIRPVRFLAKPIRLRGLDGTEIIGIPRLPLRVEEFEELYDKFPDGGLMVFAGDFEANWPYVLRRILEASKRLKAKGKELIFVTIPEYLRGHEIREVEEMPVFRDSGPEEGVNSPSLSRWVSDPLDIIVHEHTKRAMYAVRHAEMLASLLLEAYGVDVDPPIEESKTTPIEDPSGWCIEGVEDFPDVEVKYLCRDGRVTLLSRIWHLLLIGVNSDSRGWYPIIERRRHRINSLRNAELLSREVIHNALEALAGRVDFSTMEAERYFIVYNPLRARRARVSLRLGAPYKFIGVDGKPIQTMNTLTEEGIVNEAVVDVPDYGYTILGAVRGGELKRLEWRDSHSIENDRMKLTYTDGKLKLQRGGESIELFLEPFKFKRVEADEEARIVSCRPEDVKVKVRNGLNPEMLLFCPLDRDIDLIAYLTLYDDALRCRVEFDFKHPARIGEGGWMPNGLTFSVRGKPGIIYYDIPYGVVRHHYTKECFIAASKFAVLQSEGCGVALISTSGSQSFKCNGEDGILGVCLGASTVGTPTETPRIIITEDGQVHHQIKTDGEIFSGRYVHTFSVVPYHGDWREADIPQKAKQENEPVYVAEVSRVDGRDEPPRKSLIELTPRNLEITSVRHTGEGLEVAVSETHNREVEAELRVLGRTYRSRIPANGFMKFKIKAERP